MKKWNQRYHDKFKKHSLIDQVWNEKNLENAWKRVKKNKGSAGIDRVTIQEFENNLPQNLEMVIASINPVIRGWGYYFKEGTVKKRFEELDGYVRARLRSFRAKRRNWRIILYTFPKPELEKMGLVSLSSLLNHPSPAMG